MTRLPISTVDAQSPELRLLSRINDLEARLDAVQTSTSPYSTKFGAYISGSESRAPAESDIGTGGTVLRDPQSAVTTNSVYTVPAGSGGTYRISAWMNFQGSAALKRAYIRASIGGVAGEVLAAVGAPAANQNPAAGGFVEKVLAAGNTVTLRIGHDDTVNRTCDWRFLVERVV